MVEWLSQEKEKNKTKKKLAKWIVIQHSISEQCKQKLTVIKLKLMYATVDSEHIYAYIFFS